MEGVLLNWDALLCDSERFGKSVGPCNSTILDRAVAFQLIVFLRLIAEPYPVIVRHREEKSFEDPVTGEKQNFPSIDDDPEVGLSVIVPAYDEEARRKSFNHPPVAFLKASICFFSSLNAGRSH